MRRYCASCRERMDLRGKWLVLAGLIYHPTGSCARLYAQRLGAATRTKLLMEVTHERRN